MSLDAETRTATHCNPLQPTATHCNPLQPTATHSSPLQHTAAHYNTLQRAAFTSLDAETRFQNKKGLKKKLNTLAVTTALQ